MIIRFPIELTRPPVNKPRAHTDLADIERGAVSLGRQRDMQLDMYIRVIEGRNPRSPNDAA